MHQHPGRFVHGKKVRGFPEDLEVFLKSIHKTAMVGANMIHLRNVTRTYSSGSGVVRALDTVSLDIAAGEFVTISGPSGCGKSTLLNLLGGLDRPTTGEILVDGLPLHQADEKALTSYRRHTLGIVFQFFNLLPAMTVRENVELPLLLRGDPHKKAGVRVAEMLDVVGLSRRAHHFPHQLSGGEMQRTAIARALAGGPRLLLADEPTGNLDSANALNVCETLSKIASQKIAVLIIVTHSEPVAAMAPVRIQMLDGKILTHHNDRNSGR
jgi:putative ABC transport system ATP-binding protein